MFSCFYSSSKRRRSIQRNFVFFRNLTSLVCSLPCHFQQENINFCRQSAVRLKKFTTFFAFVWFYFFHEIFILVLRYFFSNKQFNLCKKKMKFEKLKIKSNFFFLRICRTFRGIFSIPDDCKRHAMKLLDLSFSKCCFGKNIERIYFVRK